MRAETCAGFRDFADMEDLNGSVREGMRAGLTCVANRRTRFMEKPWKLFDLISSYLYIAISKHELVVRKPKRRDARLGWKA